MKCFRCSHLVNNDEHVVFAEDEDTLLYRVARHARKEHDMFVTRSLIETVKSNIVDVADDRYPAQFATA